MTQDYQATIAWQIYCRETAGDLDVRDYWEQLPENVQTLYKSKADDYVRQRLFKRM